MNLRAPRILLCVWGKRTVFFPVTTLVTNCRRVLNVARPVEQHGPRHTTFRLAHVPRSETKTKSTGEKWCVFFAPPSFETGGWVGKGAGVRADVRARRAGRARARVRSRTMAASTLPIQALARYYMHAAASSQLHTCGIGRCGGKRHTEGNVQAARVVVCALQSAAGEEWCHANGPLPLHSHRPASSIRTTSKVAVFRPGF